MIQETQEYVIDVIAEDYNGKTYTKVGRPFVKGKEAGGKLSVEKAETMIDDLNLADDFALARDMAAPVEGTETVDLGPEPSFDTSEEIPF